MLRAKLLAVYVHASLLYAVHALIIVAPHVCIVYTCSK